LSRSHPPCLLSARSGRLASSGYTANATKQVIIILSAPLEFFHLSIEISIALLGFTGVAAAFGGRNRDFTELERARLLSVFSSGVPVLSLSLAALVCLEAGFSLHDTVSVLGLLGIGVGGVYSYMLIPKAAQFASDETATTSRLALALSALSMIVPGACFVAAIFLGQVWLIVLAFSVYLLIGVWIFFRLLTRLN
jgi:hypothetical protein